MNEQAGTHDAGVGKEQLEIYLAAIMATPLEAV